MNIESIKKTAIHRIEDGDHIVESPLSPMVIGAGDTEQEAWQIFNEILEDHITEFKAGRIAEGPGRPAKGKADIHLEINPEIRNNLKDMAKSFGISQGEAVEYLFSFWKAKKA